MKADDHIIDAFMLEVLEEHGEYYTGLFEDSIAEHGIVDTATLYDSLAFRVVKQGNNWVLRYSFMSYGRAVEIQYFKSRRLRRQARETRPRRRKKKKDTRFYARNAYGALNRLLGRMMYGLTDIEIQRIKNKLQNNTP